MYSGTPVARTLGQQTRFWIPLAFARFSTSFNTLRRSRRLQFNVSRSLPKEGNSGALGFDARSERSSQRSTASLAFECTGTSCSFPRFSSNRNQRVPNQRVPPSVVFELICFPDADPTMTPRDRPLHCQVRADVPNKMPKMSAMPPDRRFVYLDGEHALPRAPGRSRRFWLVG